MFSRRALLSILMSSMAGVLYASPYPLNKKIKFREKKPTGVMNVYGVALLDSDGNTITSKAIDQPMSYRVGDTFTITYVLK